MLQIQDVSSVKLAQDSVSFRNFPVARQNEIASAMGLDEDGDVFEKLYQPAPSDWVDIKNIPCRMSLEDAEERADRFFVLKDKWAAEKERDMFRDWFFDVVRDGRAAKPTFLKALRMVRTPEAVKDVVDGMYLYDKRVPAWMRSEATCKRYGLTPMMPMMHYCGKSVANAHSRFN